MRNMVNLHDLVDLAEPSWRSMAEALSCSRSREEAIDLDADMENRDRDTTELPTSLGEANLGLG